MYELTICPCASCGKAALVTIRQMFTTTPETAVPVHSAEVYRPGRLAAIPNSEPWATASAAPVSATAASVTMKLHPPTAAPAVSCSMPAASIMGMTRSATAKAQNPTWTRVPARTRCPNRTITTSVTRFGAMYTTENHRSTCRMGYSRPK